jgi:AcrR family transcriptional regulator
VSEDDKPANRLERRKQRTRAALIKAAQDFIAAGKLNVPVQEISHAADVGIGSFYNHFESKEQLFQAAVNEALDVHGALLDELTPPSDDPAETFARSFRLTGRLFRRRPDLSRVLVNTGLSLMSADRGLAPRALRDINAAAKAGRFTIRDPELALAQAAGLLFALGQLLNDQPDRDDAETTDRMTEDLLRVYGMGDDEAHEICRRPLPDLDAVTRPDSAA